jgi:branched-chain amino acid transport system permease protein
MKSIEVIAMVVLGGMGSISGSVLAAIVLTLLPEVLRPVKDYRMVIYSLMLIILMITRPQGLLGTRELSLAGCSAARPATGPMSAWREHRRCSRSSTSPCSSAA